jgi:2-succinyl-5-enolpyruvyl-6-hydroxy-3-cyclohexene-1-carboxylate synthase
VPVSCLERLDQLPAALEGHGVRVVIARTDRQANVAVHDQINRAVDAVVTAAFWAGRPRPGAPAA